MSVFPSTDYLSDIAHMLRAAGCVFAEEEARILGSSARTRPELDAMVRRRVAGLPLEQVVGWAEFCGLRIAVDEHVFVPRRRSEFLVRLAANLAGRLADPAGGPADAAGGPGTGGQRDAAGAPGAAAGNAGDSGPVVVVDLCCGSGAVGTALSAALGGGVELHAVDIDPAAVRCARKNVPAGGQVYEGDLYEPLPERLAGRVAVLVANAPYVPTAEIGLMPAEARLHEPRAALDGGPDGVGIHRRIAAAAPRWLAPGGYLLIETSGRQAPLTAGAVADAGLIPQVVSSQEWSATVVIGSAPGAGASGHSRRRAH
jgi:release factor glutamine methyltransferase